MSKKVEKKVKEDVKGVKGFFGRFETPIIVVSIVAALIMYLVTFIFMLLIVTFDSKYQKEADYNVINNTIYIKNNIAAIENVDGLYKEEKNEYVVSGYLKNNNAKYIEISVDFYDINEYIIAQKTISLDLKEGNKYKFKIVYDEIDANEISSYKINKIKCY